MPKLAKSTKRQRDLGAIKGIRKHFSRGQPIIILKVRYDAVSLAAKYEQHLRAMARVDELAMAHARAIEEEAALEAELAGIHAGLKEIVGSMVGKHEAGMLKFGMKPDKKPYMSAETKRRANEKRQETRRKRGIGGKRRR